MTVFETLEQLWNNSDVEIEKSSDSSEISEAEEEEDSFLMDPVHNQEQAGPSETQRTQPPTTSLESLSSSLSDDGAEDEYKPPAHHLHSASRPVKHKGASAPRQRSSSSRPAKRGKQGSRRTSQDTPPPGDVNTDMWHSPGEPDTEPQRTYIYTEPSSRTTN
ncbi:hypothetical protein CRENBAI_013662 [Crenichthys baileyi]|uniref:Uncharacterized protein n=1 Tax=Crenichthys baileyi TaxID=28760 RepID=A0AAV9RJU6_9TELE